MKKLVKKLLAHFGYELRRIPGYTRDKWNDSLSSEIAFWDHWCKTEGNVWKEEFEARKDPHSRLQGIFLNHLDRTQARKMILDVGAGPLTLVHKECDFADVEIHAVDPLANEYDKILSKYDIQPVVRTQQCEGEKLTEKFNQNTFDIAYSCNAIDHTYDPLRVIEEMIKVTKKGHFIILEHAEREGENGGWKGLHKWNISMEKGVFSFWKKRLCLQGRTSAKVDVAKKFKRVAELVQITKKDRLITAVFRRT